MFRASCHDTMAAPTRSREGVNRIAKEVECAQSIPSRRFHCVRYHGLFSSASKHRAQTCALAPPIESSTDDCEQRGLSVTDRGVAHVDATTTIPISTTLSSIDPERDAPYRRRRRMEWATRGCGLVCALALVLVFARSPGDIGRLGGLPPSGELDGDLGDPRVGQSYPRYFLRGAGFRSTSADCFLGATPATEHYGRTRALGPETAPEGFTPQGSGRMHSSGLAGEG